MKSDASPLTRADREANAVICQALQNISPHIPIISEENKLTPFSVRQVGCAYCNDICMNGLPLSFGLATITQCCPPFASCRAVVLQKFQYYWLVDPLDGTKEFLKRNGQFTVNIALMTNNSPVLGVVDVPCQGKTYWAVKGKGAWLRTSDGQQRIQAAEFALEDKGLQIVASASHLNKETEVRESVDAYLACPAPKTQPPGP